MSISEKGPEDVVEAINEVADDINSILDNREEEKYFEGIVLLYSFIENLLKWLVFVKLLWEKSDNVLGDKEINTIKTFAKNLRFYDVLRIAYGVGLIDFGLFRNLDDTRRDRNDIVHQFWLYTHRKDIGELRTKLETLAANANDLVEIFNRLTEKIGVDEVYEILL